MITVTINLPINNMTRSDDFIFASCTSKDCLLFRFPPSFYLFRPTRLSLLPAPPGDVSPLPVNTAAP